MKPKMNPRRSNKFPKSALAFYIKLYCKQKGSSETNFKNHLIEATKTWVSLSESEKEQFHKKFKECEHKFKVQCFTQLKNAETFMKAKDTKLNNSELITTHLEEKPEQHVEEVIQNTDAVHFDEGETSGSDDKVITDVGLVEQNDTVMEPIDTNEHSSQVNPSSITQTYLVEPLPPTLRTGKDLFHIMQNNTDRSNNIMWTSLPQFEKKYYSRAVCILKKDYINKYKLYLESLSPRDLFHYYNEITFNTN